MIIRPLAAIRSGCRFCRFRMTMHFHTLYTRNPSRPCWLGQRSLLSAYSRLVQVTCARERPSCEVQLPRMLNIAFHILHIRSGILT